MNITKEQALEQIEQALKQIEQLKEFVQNCDQQDKEREEWFLSILLDLKVGNISKESITHNNSKGEWMIQDRKNGEFWLSYDRIWEVLNETYGMKYNEIREFTKTMLVKHMNWKVVTTVTLW